MFTTDWVAPGGGDTVERLARYFVFEVTGYGTASGGTRTALRVVRAGEPTPYDRERAVEALRRVGVVVR